MTPHLTERFKPIRAGLLNLFEYGHQIFEFADGHLLLRGHNGAGKSKALELLLPFVLDGDTHPTKLDPFATTARQMKWNLTLGGAHESRWGYAWLEFARQRPDQDPEYVTLAVGVRAHHQTPDATTWFLVIHGRRLGHDISLLNDSTGTPHLRRGILDALGDGVEVFDVAGEYRERVNTVLFGFPTNERYDTMLELQRQLRRPQLAKSLDPEQLSNILTNALPEVDRRLIADIGTHLDTIEQLRRDLRGLMDVRDQLKRFLDTYKAYAGAVVYERASTVAATAGDVEAERKALKAKTDAAAACETRIIELDGELARLEGELERQRGAERELLASDAMRSANELRELEERVAGLGRELSRLVRDVKEALTEREKHERVAENARAEAEKAEEELTEACVELEAIAAEAGVEAHDALIEQLAESEEPEALARVLGDAARAREGEVREQERLAALAGQARFQADEKDKVAARLEGHERSAQERRAICDGELVTARDSLVAGAQEWLDELAVLVPSEAEAEQLLDAAASAGEEPRTLRRVLDERFAVQDGALVRADAEAATEQQRFEGGREPLLAERDELRDARDPEPERPHTRDSDRTAQAGAPLWRVVDFADALSSAERAGLEAALEGSGLLDAWLTPDGKLLDVDGELVLASDAPEEGSTLSEVLHPVADARVGESVVAGALAAIGFGDTDGRRGVRVAADGSYRLGPAFGRFTKPAAQFIGQAARDANRARRLRELDVLIANVDGTIKDIEEQRAANAKQRQTLRDELGRLPSEDAVESAFAAVRDIQRDVTRLGGEASDARRSADEAGADAEKAERTATEYARAHGLPTSPEAREQVRKALADYPNLLGPAVLIARDARSHAAEVAAAEDLAKAVETRRSRADEERGDVSRELSNRRGALEELQAQQGDGARDAVARLEELTDAIKTTERELRVAGDERMDARVQKERSETEAGEVERRLVELRQAAHDALVGFRELHSHDFLQLSLPGDAPTPQELQGWGSAEVVALLRRHQLALGGGKLSVEALTERVYRDSDELRHGIDGSLGITTYLERRDGVVVAGASQGGHDRPVRVLVTSLDEEIDAQERTLTEEDQKTFERFLFNGIAQHLRTRISGAQRLVEDTNKAIVSCQTSSGKGIELAWDSLADDDPLLRRALKLLKSSPEALTEQQREQLIRFFRDRVELARQSEEEGTAEQHLLGALDYRRWHHFKVFQTQDGEKVLLTKKQHEAGSGGEKAAALHLPLFAAAAAHMESAEEHAPRLVMLDEAFAGIDGQMRPQLLGLIEHFDLDFMLTSHELWCCERELGHLSIYQLHREEGVPGVAAVRFLWDGAEGKRSEVPEEAMPA